MAYGLKKEVHPNPALLILKVQLIPVISISIQLSQKELELVSDAQ